MKIEANTVRGSGSMKPVAFGPRRPHLSRSAGKEA